MLDKGVCDTIEELARYEKVNAREKEVLEALRGMPLSKRRPAVEMLLAYAAGADCAAAGGAGGCPGGGRSGQAAAVRARQSGA